MKSRKFIWHLFPVMLLVVLLSLAVFTVATIQSVRSFHMDQTARVLVEKARGLSDLGALWMTRPEAAERDSLCRDMGHRLDARITLIDASGVVMGDSRHVSHLMENHGAREEIAAALDGRVGHSVRYSRTLKYNSLYQAIPLLKDGEVTGVIRLSHSLDDVEKALQRLRLRIALSALIVAVLATLASLLMSRRISSPLEKLRQGAERFANGDLNTIRPDYGTAEVGNLAEAMNIMAGELSDRIGTIEGQRNELAAVFSSMVEGVLVVDERLRIVSVNDSAARLLAVDSASAPGMSLTTVARHPALLEFINKALHSSSAVESDIALVSGAETVDLQVHGLRLEGSSRARRALIVLNDVTRLRRLEKVRQDFVANVSHELKTPVTSIKGFVETLQNGALENDEDARRFLAIISRQSDRLQAIIEDLLCLSRLEQGSGATGRDLGVYAVADVLTAAAQSCMMIADKQRMRLQLDCDEALRTRLDPDLMEQAVVNLVENAIKYSDEPGTITISAGTVDDHVLISVRDRGRGIEEHHIPRLFERFYRVDKARSRNHGGTGLGLAIVKHIAVFHGGQVSVMSKPDEGSQFTIQIPWETNGN
jgi:two-component system, OmpR family, phosphate regulon sensor histidine kinase PhoR